MSKITDLGDKINKMADEDVNNPEIYELLREIVYRGIYGKVYDKVTEDIIITEMAGDLYLKLIDGIRFEYWHSYINKWFYSYIKEFKEYNNKQYFNMEGDPEVVYSMVDLFSGSFSLCNFDQVNFSEVTNLDFIEYLPKAMKEQVYQLSRYSDSTINLNLYISVLMSFIRDLPCSYRLGKKELNYVNLIKEMASEEISSDLKDLSGSELYFERSLMSSILKVEREYDQYE